MPLRSNLRQGNSNKQLAKILEPYWNRYRGLVNVQAGEGFCEVFVDGNFFGNTPAKLTLEEGAHLVEVKGSGQRKYQRELQVPAGSEVKLQAVWEETRLHRTPPRSIAR